MDTKDTPKTSGFPRDIGEFEYVPKHRVAEYLWKGYEIIDDPVETHHGHYALIMRKKDQKSS